MITPALAVTTATANSTVGIFEDLPEYITIDQQSQRNTLWATQGGQQVPFAQVFDQNRQEVAWDEVSQFAKDAAVAGEDERFYEHGGVDVAGIARAAVNNITSSSTQGASTLSQQLVKNLFIQQALTLETEEERMAAYNAAQESTIDRKLREAKLAIGLEKRYTKEQILLGYLNIAGYGGNTYGIESAAQQYYSTSAKDLTLAQAASLVAIVQTPNLRNPGNPENWERNQGRRDAILGNMLDQGMVTQEQYDEAIATPVNETTVLLSEPANGCINATAAKYFCDYVIKNIKNLEALGATPEERQANWKRGGYDVYTTIDLDQQANATDVVMANAPADESRFQLGSAVSTVEVGTGRIVVMAQNKEFNDSADGGGPTATAVNFNTDQEYGGSSGFQSGSTYKLFTLVEWLEQGRGLQESVDGAQKTYTNRMLPSECAPGNAPFPVFNDSRQDAGRMNVLRATAGSVNAAFYSMAGQLDLCDIRDTAKAMGVHRADGNELQTFGSIVLGTDEVAPLSIANAYATVASGGILCQPIAVDRVVAADGTELAGQNAQCSQAIAPEVAAAAAYALEGVMTGNGTGARANPRDGTALIGKTGTADAFHTWMVESSTEVATAVWVGNIVGKQNLRRINVGGVRAGDIRYAIARPIMAALNASPLYANTVEFPDPPRALLNGSSVTVPSLIGQTPTAARQQLERLGFDYVDGGTVASERPAGQVAATNPPAGTLASQGAPITVSVSDGSLAATVPDLAGQSQRDAIGTLEEAGYDPARVSFVYTQGDDAQRCQVTGSDPAGGTGGSTDVDITLNVNGGAMADGAAPDCS
ncbi:transglycosylase domain-containing protein [Marisediminicola senii]|uniref:transglycosylase domain-containing protein n=1 Tax=Marisediminicola senii TaxID=2711233 RepID=UPI0013EB54E8|nr:transglycosylase domain-containing protein [Marisediminicola senii]